MKLRINGNSLRLRLSPKEVTQLCYEGKVIDRCAIGKHQFMYSITARKQDQMQVVMMEKEIEVYIPSLKIQGWDTNEHVGFEHKDHHDLLILVEKDYQCLQPRAKEKEDHLYANPLKK